MTPRARLAAALVALLVPSFAFRVPELVHAREVNSDAAIVGLQAMHMARGELSPLLWGSTYQSSADALWAVPFFAVLGPRPEALVLSALVLHVLVTLTVFFVARRHALLARLASPSLSALVVALPLVFTTAAVHTYALYPPRQLSITLAFVALTLADGASSRAHRLAWSALSGSLAVLSCAADPYALIFAPLVALLLVLSSFDGASGSWIARARSAVGPLAASAAGALVGAAPLWLVWRSEDARLGVTHMDAGRVAHNWDLLVRECGPWAFGATSYYARHMMDYAPWEPHWLYALFARAAVALFLAAFPVSLVLVLAGGRLPWETRRSGLVGALALPLSLAGFLTSVMVMDHFSMRYLASVPLLLPFALLPLAAKLGPRKLLALLAPYLVAAGVSGWVSFGPDVRGPFVAPRAPGPTDEERVAELLASRKITTAMADYWIAYRFTFLARESVVVVPTHERQDRRRSYRDAFGASREVAYLVDPTRTGESQESVEKALREGALANEPGFEKETVGRFTVFFFRHPLP